MDTVSPPRQLQYSQPPALETQTPLKLEDQRQPGPMNIAFNLPPAALTTSAPAIFAPPSTSNVWDQQSLNTPRYHQQQQQRDPIPIEEQSTSQAGQPPQVNVSPPVWDQLSQNTPRAHQQQPQPEGDPRAIDIQMTSPPPPPPPPPPPQANVAPQSTSSFAPTLEASPAAVSQIGQLGAPLQAGVQHANRSIKLKNQRKDSAFYKKSSNNNHEVATLNQRAEDQQFQISPDLVLGTPAPPIHERFMKKEAELLKKGLTIAQVARKMKAYFKGVEKREQAKAAGRRIDETRFEELPNQPSQATALVGYKPNVSYMPKADPTYHQRMQAVDNISTINATDLLAALADDLSRVGNSSVAMAQNVGNSSMNLDSPINQRRAIGYNNQAMNLDSPLNQQTQRAIGFAPSTVQQQSIVYAPTPTALSPREVVQSTLQSGPRDVHNWSMTMPPPVPGITMLDDGDVEMGPPPTTIKKRRKRITYVPPSVTSTPAPIVSNTRKTNATPPAVSRAATLSIPLGLQTMTWLSLPNKRKRVVEAPDVQLNRGRGTPQAKRPAP